MTRVLFATAELVPLTRVGGLGEAAAGLVHEQRASGVDVEVVLPDYAGLPLEDETYRDLAMPDWAGPARARSGIHPAFGRVTLIEAGGLARPHPYNDPASGEGWVDNTYRFFAFSAGVAALARALRPDVLHLNDWHTSMVLGMLEAPPPSVLTIHNAAYQGITDGSWLARLPTSRAAFEWGDDCNPLAGGVTLADRVVAVSPTYAREILRPEGGVGLDAALRARGAALTGILNGIDTGSWDPRTDPELPAHYDLDSLEGKARCREALLAELGWEASAGPLIAMVTRLTEQKGIDLAFEAVPELPRLGARLVLLGSGDRALADQAAALAGTHPEVMWFSEDFNEGRARRLFAGCDLLLMPSRFEPCGLTQMQALAYGTIPVVTPVGGLRDTVIDADRTRWDRLEAARARLEGAFRGRAAAGHRPRQGNGFVAASVDELAVRQALGRAVRAWGKPRRRRALQHAGMSRDWSWRAPARQYRALYEELLRAA